MRPATRIVFMSSDTSVPNAGAPIRPHTPRRRQCTRPPGGGPPATPVASRLKSAPPPVIAAMRSTASSRAASIDVRRAELAGELEPRAVHVDADDRRAAGDDAPPSRRRARPSPPPKIAMLAAGGGPQRVQHRTGAGLDAAAERRGDRRAAISSGSLHDVALARRPRGSRSWTGRRSGRGSARRPARATLVPSARPTAKLCSKKPWQ